MSVHSIRNKTAKGKLFLQKNMNFSAFRRIFDLLTTEQAVFLLHNVAQFAGSTVLQKKFCRGILFPVRARTGSKYFRSVRVDFDFLTVYVTI